MTMLHSPLGAKWDDRFMEMARLVAGWSKDPSRKVGAVIVDASRRVLATGFNGLPRGMEDTEDRLQRPTKYDYVCHAEVNAIYQCASLSTSCQGAVMYTTFSPCTSCALGIIQAGISCVVAPPIPTSTEADREWAPRLQLALRHLNEAGVMYITKEAK